MPCTDSYKIEERGLLKRKIFSILIVDDDTDVANSLKGVLELRGHNIVVVDDGMRCITHCKDREKHYDIVFMDYHMEGLDGAQVTEIVKSDDSRTLIFAYTGDDSQKAINEFKQAGMDGAIIKPIDIKSIELLMSKLELSVILDTSIIKNITKKSCRSILIFEKSTTGL
jgi:two-component system sensor histidine kinase/response regulator